MDKVYLGDGVYAEIDKGCLIKLTVSDGITTLQTIYLDSGVVANLKNYLEMSDVQTALSSW